MAPPAAPPGYSLPGCRALRDRARERAQAGPAHRSAPRRSGPAPAHRVVLLEEAKAVIAKHTGLKPELVRDIALPAFEKKLIESDIDPLLDAALRYKMVEKKFPPRELISKYMPG